MTEFCIAWTARLRRAAAVMMVGAFCLLATGCAVSPQAKQSLSKYVQASDQVLQTAVDLVNDYESRVRAGAASAESSASAPVPAFPGRFVLKLVVGDRVLTEDELAIASTREALEVLREYNALLVALAEGRSEAELQQQAGAVGGALQQLASIGGFVIPGVASASQLLGKAAKLWQDAKNREQMVKLVADGKDTVTKIFLGMREQVPAFYSASVAETEGKQNVLLESIGRVVFHLDDLVKQHSAPVHPAVAVQMAELELQVAEVARKTRTRSKTPFSYVAGKSLVDADVAAQAGVLVQSMRVHAQRKVELVAAQNAFYDALVKYVIALTAMETAFDKLSVSLNAPLDLRAEVRHLIGVGSGLRDAVTAFRRPNLVKP